MRWLWIAMMSLTLTVSACGRDDDDSKPKPKPAEEEQDDDNKEGGNLTPDPSDDLVGGNEAVARFRGIVETDNILHERLIANRDYAFFLGNYLGGYSAQYLYGLPQLLGYSDGNGLSSDFRNG